MPMPVKGEKKDAYLARYMASPQAQKDFPDADQRYAVALSEWEQTHKSYNPKVNMRVMLVK